MQNIPNTPTSAYYVSDKIKNYITSLRGKIIDVKRRVVHEEVQVIPYENFCCSMTLEYKTENVLILELPERELDQIAKMRTWYENNINGYDINRLDDIIKDHHHEKDLRENNPVLKKVYEQYKIMLSLVDDHTYHNI